MAGILTALIPLLSALASGSGFSAAIQAALLPSLQTVFAGTNIAGALAGITVTQWISLAVNLAEVAPEVSTDVHKMFADLHPIMAKFIADMKLGGVQNAAANIRAWVAENQPPTIPGYAADGSITQIPNPNYKR